MCESCRQIHLALIDEHRREIAAVTIEPAEVAAVVSCMEDLRGYLLGERHLIPPKMQ